MNPLSAQPTQPTHPQRLIVAITGATGAIYGVRLLQTLQRLPHIETHLIVSEAGWLTIAHELDMSKDAIRALAHTTHAVNNIGASIASGSFLCDGMIVAPCSMKTLSAIAHGYSDNLISRAADAALNRYRGTDAEQAMYAEGMKKLDAGLMLVEQNIASGNLTAAKAELNRLLEIRNQYHKVLKK